MKMARRDLPFLLLFLFQYVMCNLVHNPDFEITNVTGLRTWSGNGGKIAYFSYDVNGGKFSLESYARINSSQGPSQFVPVKPGGRYRFKVYVKQLKDKVGTLSQTYTGSITYTWDNGGKEEYTNIVRQPGIQASTGWFLMESIFATPNNSFSQALLSVNGPDVGVNFLVDNFLLEEINDDPNWELEANSRISKIRTNKIHFVFTNELFFKPADVYIKIDHKNHLFGFGAVADTSEILEEKGVQQGNDYKAFFYDTFNWATVGSLVLPGSTLNQDNNRTIFAMKALQHNGVKVRAASSFSGQSANFTKLRNTDMLNQTAYYMSSIIPGLIDQWEVLNGVLEDQSYRQIYEMMLQANPSLHLLLNEKDVVVTGSQTQAYAQLAKEMKAYGLKGIGAKSNFIMREPDPLLLKLRLDILAASGLPVWISELSVSNKDEDTRANVLERALRIYFSHPAVEGVTFKDFWDPAQQTSTTALFQGYDFKPTAGGKRVLDLIKKDWSTHVSRGLNWGASFTVDGFHGDYDVRVFHKGTLVMQDNLRLGKSDMVYEMHITRNGSILPTTTLATSETSETSATSTKAARSAATLPPSVTSPATTTPSTTSQFIGNASSRADHVDLQCVTRWSNISAVGDDESTVVSCEGDEVLTGCSSTKHSAVVLDRNTKWYHDGEFLVQYNGRTVCKAVNGFGSSKGVYAVARCCSARGLACEYKSAGPSKNEIGATIQTVCQDNYTATGCMGLQSALGSRGAYPSNDGKRCIAENGENNFGVFSAAACCYAPGLVCHKVYARQGGNEHGHGIAKACLQTGYIMVSCNGRSDVGKMGGAHIEENASGSRCVVSNSEKGLTAIAVCCQINQGQQAPLLG